jgi:hypothetical protein
MVYSVLLCINFGERQRFKHFFESLLRLCLQLEKTFALLQRIQLLYLSESALRNTRKFTS